MIGGMNVDVSQFTASLKMLGHKADQAKGPSALSVGYELMRLSQIEVPHGVGVSEGGTDRFPGTLQNSGNVQQIGEDVVVGYHTPYAARLHEHPEYHFQKGRKGKYLEDPIVRNADVLGISFGKSFEANL